MKMVNFHLTFGYQYGNRLCGLRIHFRPFEWQFGDVSYRVGVLRLYWMFSLGPFALQCF